ncbi:DUF3152 domain-containing protein [Streptomyces cyaneofuscatus]|uniref:DUF3152 domain-containing protein n=1 Tax=Streptomyces cyaneofuscatus TaxID=66883 RepID=UPI003808DAB2
MTGRRGSGTLPRDEPARDAETFRLRTLPGDRAGAGCPGRAGSEGRSGSRSQSRSGNRSQSRSRSRERRRRRNRRRTAGLAVLALAAVALVALLVDRPWQNRDPSVTADAGPTTGTGTDKSAGLVVKIGTAATTDRLCGAYGLKTRGEVNCRGGEQVMVNLKRWQLGSPQFDGPVAEYRALIINHEVGHWLGRGHETCPGKGRPAPAMMQQIDGLKGCVANAWPYDAKGRYLGGPKVP